MPTAKRLSERKTESVEFEDYIWPTIRRRFPQRLGWEIEQEKTLSNGSRVDYALWRYNRGKKQKAVIEAMNVKELLRRDVDHLDEYARTYYATHRLIAVPMGTIVSDMVRDYMDELEIELVRTRFVKMSN